jgi:hypothetical protein
MECLKQRIRMHVGLARGKYNLVIFALILTIFVVTAMIKTFKHFLGNCTNRRLNAYKPLHVFKSIISSELPWSSKNTQVI